ncbi:MAG: hypothetical protein CL578_06175 [Alteromonadaceae bacterium]|nr:hypothetical protein [Alteromonadaceae bacterium]|tara:strand:- start:36750 stop:36986 length:237 start_codon:yes stop_codon:yes gene_type:complete
MINLREVLSNIVAISPRSIGIIIVVGGWEPIYQLLMLFNVVEPTFSGFFITVGISFAVLFFIFDYMKLKKRQKQMKER